MWPEEEWLRYRHIITQGHQCFLCNCSKGMEWTLGIRCTCIHVLICVHILTRVWDQKRVTVTHMQCHTWTVTFSHTCKRHGIDMGSHVNMHTSTDAYTHSKQGVGSEEVWLGHTHTQFHSWEPLFASNYAKVVQQTWGESVAHVYMYWWMYTF